MLLASSFTCPAHAAKSHQRCEIVKIYSWPQVDNAGTGVFNIETALDGTRLIVVLTVEDLLVFHVNTPLIVRRDVPRPETVYLLHAR